MPLLKPLRRPAGSVLLLAIAALSPVAAHPQSPASVFGYSDFTQQSKIDTEFLAVPDAKLAGQELKTLTANPHIASSPEDHETALYVAQKFKAAGLETTIVPYRVLLNQPRKVSFEARSDDGTILATGPTPEHVAGDPYQDDPRVVMPFNGSSGSGDVTGEVVYANYGRLEDFDQLAAQHIDLHGKIVLVRYGGNFRGVKVYIAQQRGAIGVLIYSDPQDDGYFQRRSLSQRPVASGDRRAARLGAVSLQVSRRPGDSRRCLHQSTCPTRPASRPEGNQPASSPSPSAITMPRPFCRLLRPRRAQGLAGRAALPLSRRRNRREVHLVSQQDYQAAHLGRHRKNQRLRIPRRLGGRRQSSRRLGLRRSRSQQRHRGHARSGARHRRVAQAGLAPKRTIVFAVGMPKKKA
jgi:N-acetylated-alpha-linked acidic dipeptidase